MKLIYCYECRDMVALIPMKQRECQCGLSKGRYILTDQSTTFRLAEVEGPLMVIGIDNRDLVRRCRKFSSYRIPPADPWLRWIGDPPPERLKGTPMDLGAE